MKIYKVIQHSDYDWNTFPITAEEARIVDKMEIILEDKGKVFTGIFTDSTLDYIHHIFRKYKITYEVKDITSSYVKTSTLFNSFLQKHHSKKDDIKRFMFSNVTKDDILDKINEYGMESLTEIDREILIK